MRQKGICENCHDAGTAEYPLIALDCGHVLCAYCCKDGCTQQHCVECGTGLHLKDSLIAAGHPNLYECPRCGHPS